MTIFYEKGPVFFVERCYEKGLDIRFSWAISEYPKTILGCP